MDNKKNYDSTFCGSLPLHLINLVQPYGVLVVLNKIDLNIIQVSENIETALGITASKFVNTSLTQYVNEQQISSIKQKYNLDISAKVPLTISFNLENKSVPFLAIMHVKDDYIILELEQIDEHFVSNSFINIYEQVKYTMANINVATSTKDICNTAIDELKKISGFDRIMIYEFDEDWNGTVIAETYEEGLEPYLGLRFPASDIPKQARDLYFKNPYRLIPTVDYTPVKIYPVINPENHSFINLSNCNLRSVAAVHIEYLNNMGVKASMSTAIIKDDKLWGLISCHHRTAKYLSYEKCSQFELLSGVISSRLSSIENKEALAANNALREIQADLVKQVYASDNLFSALIDYSSTILQLLQCDGVVIAYDRKVQIAGNTPSLADVKELIYWLQNQPEEGTFTETNLSSVFEEAIHYKEIASGIIVLPIHKEKGQFIVGFRPEVIQKVDWGGNPNEAIKFEKDNLKYHPRNSFKQWREIVKGTSVSWKKDEIAIAESFRNFVIEYTLKKIYA